MGQCRLVCHKELGWARICSKSEQEMKSIGSTLLSTKSNTTKYDRNPMESYPSLSIQSSMVHNQNNQNQNNQNQDNQYYNNNTNHNHNKNVNQACSLHAHLKQPQNESTF